MCVWAVLAILAASVVKAQDTGFDFGSEPEGETAELSISADYQNYDKNLQVFHASGNVVATYEEVTIHADQLEYHQATSKVFARDNVRIFQNGETIEAEEIIYNLDTKEIVTSDLKSALEPIFFTTEQINRPAEGSDDPIILEDATFTTHDSANPNFHFKVKKLQVYPDDILILENAKLYVGTVPVFWFPYYVQPLNDELGYYFTPGWNSVWGAFLLNRYGFNLGDKILATAHLDLRSERGLAGGFDFESKKFKGNPNIGRLKLYYANDDNPQLAFNGRNRTRDIPNSDRYRINFQHRIYLPGPLSDDNTFYIDFDINKLSDAFFYEDFFPGEFRIDPQPDNLINLTKLFDQGEISLTGRFAVNDFFQTDTRSPELAIDVIRTPLADSGFFYEGMTTYGVIGEELAETSRNPDPLDPPGFNRFQTYHEFLYPAKIGALNVVPRVGGGYRNYSNFDVPGIDDFDSTTFHAGVDLSFKLSKHSPHVVNRKLGLDGLLHVVRPYANYSIVRTDEINGHFTGVDRFTPTTRLRPIDLPLFTSVDDTRDWQIVRTGVSQNWYTKRNGQTHEWLSLDTYLELYPEDPEFDRDVSNLFVEAEWRPLPWLSASTTAQFPLFDDQADFTEVTSSLYFMPNDRFRIGLGTYYLNDHPLFRDSNQYTLSTYTRLNDDFGFSTSHRFQAEDGVLEYQQYTLHKDLASWTASIGAIVRDNRNTEREYGIALSLTLKAFPRVSLPVDFQPGSLGAE